MTQAIQRARTPPTGRAAPQAAQRAVQATLARGGDFNNDKTRYPTAYRVFFETMSRTVSDFRELDYDSRTELYFTTEDTVPTAAETRFEVWSKDGWVRDSDPTMVQHLHANARIRLVIAIQTGIHQNRLASMLQTLIHEWAIHAHHYWQFAKWMRLQGSESDEDIQDEWRLRNKTSYKGPHPLHGDLHHTTLAHDESQLFRDMAKVTSAFLPDWHKKKLQEYMDFDVKQHDKFKRPSNLLEIEFGSSNNSSLANVNLDFLENDNKEFEDWLNEDDDKK
ncbi:MAG: hypothetical protein U0002_17330 [Thermoanaerobaculia bacterium]